MVMIGYTSSIKDAVLECKPARGDRDDDGHATDDCRDDRARPIDKGSQDQRESQRDRDLHPCRVVRPDEKTPAEKLLEGLGVDFHSRYDRVERRGPQVEKSRRAGADKRDAPPSSRRGVFPWITSAAEIVRRGSRCEKDSHSWPSPSVGMMVLPMRTATIPGSLPPRLCAPRCFWRPTKPAIRRRRVRDIVRHRRERSSAPDAGSDRAPETSSWPSDAGGCILEDGEMSV